MKAHIFAVAFDANGADLSALPFPEVVDKDQPFTVYFIGTSVEEVLAYCRKFACRLIGIRQADECIVCGTITDFE